MVWVSQIELEAGRLREKIERQQDEDGLGGGTGNTFEKLKEHAAAAEKLINKFRLLLRTASLFYMISAYFDPMVLHNEDATRISQPDTTTNALLVTLQQLREKSNSLLDSALWNKKETLRIRKEDMEKEIQRLVYETQEEKKFFADGIGQLEGQLSRIRDPQGIVRMAIAFDSAGNPEHVKLLSESQEG